MTDENQSGEIISHYRLVDQIGAGGMGVVFKAQDLKLDRYVALKFLPSQVKFAEEEKQRFIQEAKVTSALDHPNICTIHEIDETEDGRMFIAMAFYEGENLRERLERGPLTTDETITVATQICDGLSKAHDRGVIHRDMKPDNVIITDDEIVKIVDFGISKLAGVQGLTQPGTLMGTPAYMSPEQIKGDKVDNRTDIWSVGVLIYNMLTCDMPFKADTNVSLMFSIVNDDPAPTRKGVPDKFAGIIAKALEKNPKYRYQSISDLKNDLKSQDQKLDSTPTKTFTARIMSAPSIAVLPFRDMSPKQDQGFLTEGLAEAITTILARVDDLRVVSRHSVFKLFDQNLEISEIGRQLRVDQILQGSIRRSGDRLRVSIQLVNVEDEVVSWAEDFEQTMDAIFDLEDDITDRVVEVLKVGQVDQGASPVAHTTDAEAYTAYLKGRFHWNRRTVKSLKKSIGFFTDAIDIDSGFASAYAGLSDAQIILGMYGVYAPADVMPRAKDSAVRALEIDEGLAEAHVALGCIEAVYEWQWGKSEIEFKRGIELNANYATGHHWYCVNHLVPLGRFEEANREIRRALLLDPVSLPISATIGLTHYFARDHERATKELKKTLEMDPNFPMANFFLGQVYTQRSMFVEALNHFRIALDQYGQSPNMRASYGYSAAQAGRKEITEEILSELTDLSKSQYVSSVDLAVLQLGLGQVEGALQNLQKAYEERAYMLIYLNVNPMMDDLRSHPEFEVLSQRIFHG